MGSEDQLWTGFWTLAGSSFLGFVTLAKWIHSMSKSVKEAIALEKHILEINKNIVEMKGALLGTYSDKGLITRVHETEKRLEKLENKG